ncbi:MAG TPA: hypothetical protein VMG34_00385 [Bacteroidota bacterium]|nr:hypothetical protein [Bacteroidota bacterium]
MKQFQSLASAMIEAMEEHALKLGVKGVIVVAGMDSSGGAWESSMKAVKAIKSIAEDPKKSEYPGYNFIGIAYSKAAEMADTRINSGSKVRPPYQGEYGFQGGSIRKTAEGYLLAVFSGATGEQDFEIAEKGIEAFERMR